MPAVSKAQSRFLNARFGHSWVKAHHFNNSTSGLPEHKETDHMSKPPLGSGARFAALKNKLSHRPGVTNPGALAAYIGRKKYGASRFASLAAKGRK